MTAPAQRIVPSIWYPGTAEEAGATYARILPHTTSTVASRYPLDGLLEFQEPLAGQPLTVSVDVWGTPLTLINAGDEFRPTSAISFILNFDPILFGGATPEAEQAARAALDSAWAELAGSGTVHLELGEYPFSAHYGWVEDRFGVHWQLFLSDPAGDPRPFVIPSLTLSGEVQDRAAEASDFYVSILRELPEGAAIGQRHPYGVATGPAGPDALAFGEFRVGHQWIAVADAGIDRYGEFTPGVSLEIRCDDQAEIDRLWHALSAVPEAEQCGWLTDRYGVSWQVVPRAMDELMDRPHAFEHLMSMKRIVIDDL